MTFPVLEWKQKKQKKKDTPLASNDIGKDLCQSTRLCTGRLLSAVEYSESGRGFNALLWHESFCVSCVIVSVSRDKDSAPDIRTTEHNARHHVAQQNSLSLPSRTESLITINQQTTAKTTETTIPAPKMCSVGLGPAALAVAGPVP